MIKPVNTIQKLKSGSRVIIAAIGDSLTRGWMVRKGYIDQLREMLTKAYPECELTIINQGIPGDTADCGVYRLQSDILDYKPDCVFIQYAINDAFMGFTITQFHDYIKMMIDAIRQSGDSEIVLITSSYIGDNQARNIVEEYYQHLVELGQKYGLPVAMVHSYWKKKIDEGYIDFQSLVQYDQVHPTEKGYRLMAEAVMELFS